MFKIKGPAVKIWHADKSFIEIKDINISRFTFKSFYMENYFCDNLFFKQIIQLY